SASDYGSEGYRFESCRGHLKHKIRSESCGFFCFSAKPGLPEALEKSTKTQRRQAMWILYFQVGTLSGTAKLILSRSLKAQNPQRKLRIFLFVQKPSYV
ncbi:hypothetical protein, partial [Salinimicrobium oceani]|uniref:hypothetical protein n=1 Tax=Salinimicrobium oceani TaxID=2722702 RepID=UPI001ADDD564